MKLLVHVGRDGLDLFEFGHNHLQIFTREGYPTAPGVGRYILQDAVIGRRVGAQDGAPEAEEEVGVRMKGESPPQGAGEVRDDFVVQADVDDRFEDAWERPGLGHTHERDDVEVAPALIAGGAEDVVG